mmetsp:Transcript_3572/g.7671  ORF Transcript_3572/g.7671 Transcript_3572/m.7671 type:complete len:270 (+) Transcript_3572:2739-3548(+)|eukprot:CAMPEP_0204899356 /NCGR_PEP_ID=MMETSP1397-20131031/1808_1 /ASSEMBLY_ACC=CAM_ASM_000891 /TAXON_ID=49980 /ORGANISM="Climacostomum Climacostomum virens, Strain Stock W-24" /LENGTH=269 /DNA_ID=CAMNT_0052067307 /DNA_START=2721 /DNA_END=3530 /DNA_ORIENTATION=+
MSDAEALTKEQQEVAKFALLAGVQKVSKVLSVPEADVSKWVRLLRIEELPLIQRVRESILELSQRKSPTVAAKSFGLSERYVSEMLSDYLNTATEPDNTTFPYDTVERFTQTCHTIETDWKHTDTQTEADDGESRPKDTEEKKQTRQYTTADKISAVRDFMKHTSQSAAARELNIPYMSLTRWRDKIRNELFQEPHVASIYSAERRGRDKFFQDMDEALYSWYCKNKERYPSPEEALLYKAKSVAKIEDAEPKVAESWMEAFKKHYNIN